MAEQKKERNDSFGLLDELSAESDNEGSITDNGVLDPRPFIIIDGHKYIHVPANDKPNVSLKDLEDNDRIKSIPITPRRVNLGAKLCLFLSNTDFAWFGILFLLFGLVFMLLLTCISGLNVHYLRYDLGKWTPYEHPCTLNSSDFASIIVNNSKVYQHQFTVLTADGKTINGKCYSYHQYKPSDSFKVLQSVSNNEIYKLEGTTLGKIDTKSSFFFMILISVFPATGFFISFWGIPRAFRRIALLENGSVYKAIAVKIEETGTRINHKAVQKIHYVYLGDDGERHEITSRNLQWEKITDEEYEIMFCDNSHPNRAVLLDELPNGIKMDSTGFTTSLFRIFPLACVYFLCLLMAGLLLISLF